MTQRENILSLFRRSGYEFMPVCFELCPALERCYAEQTGSDMAYQDYYDFPWRRVGPPVLSDRESIDWRSFYPCDLHELTTFDVWGIAREPGSAAAMHMTRMHHPVKGMDSLDRIKAYPFPDFADADYSHVKQEVDSLHGRGLAALFRMSDMIWEIAWFLRSMETLMMDMATEDEMATFVLDKTTEQACVRVAEYAEKGVDIIHTGDDIGMQDGMMMAPDFWREWIKPRFAGVIKTAKDVNPDIIFSYHSCGYIEPVIEDFIEIGVDILNPIQPECMSFENIHAAFGDRLSFWGTMGTQTTMPFGSPKEFLEAIRKNLAIAGDKGGLLCAPTHLLEPEVPWANIEAYIAACKEWK